VEDHVRRELALGNVAVVGDLQPVEKGVAFLDLAAELEAVAGVGGGSTNAITTFVRRFKSGPKFTGTGII